MTAPATVDYQRLNSLLWRYRQLLDRFEFLLEIQLLVASSGQRQWQHHMAELFIETADAISELDLERETLFGSDLVLTDHVASAPEPWDEILADQAATLAALSGRVTDLRQRNEVALAEGLAGLQSLVDALVASTGVTRPGAGPSYGEDGRIRQQSGPSILFNGTA